MKTMKLTYDHDHRGVVGEHHRFTLCFRNNLRPASH